MILESKSDVAKILRLQMKETGYDVYAVAQKANLHFSTVQRVLDEKYDVGISVINALFGVFGKKINLEKK